MAGHLPQWSQSANRHSYLTDPVITIQELGRFKPLRTTRIDHALVFTRPKGGYDTYLPPHRPSRSELTTKRWSTVYEVDTGVHRVAAELVLPSDDDAFSFSATLEGDWQVKDPARFVTSGERDVPTLITSEVERTARQVSRGFPAQDSPGAERAVQRAISEAEAVGGAAGLLVTCVLRLRLDEETLAHRRELRAIRYADEKLDPRHSLAVREDELTAQRTLAQGQQQHEIALQTQQLDHERTLLRGKQDVELQAIEAQKIEFYQYHLQQGGVAAWAFHLAQHPEDSKLVMENLRQDQLLLIHSQMELATRVITNGEGLEEYELEQPRQLALNAMHNIFNQRLPGVANISPAGASTPEQLSAGQESAPPRASGEEEAQQPEKPHASGTPDAPDAPDASSTSGRPDAPADDGGSNGTPLVPPAS